MGKVVKCGCSGSDGLVFTCGKHEVRGGKLVCKKSGKPWGYRSKAMRGKKR